MTLEGYIVQHAWVHPTRTAVIDAKGSLNYAQLMKRVALQAAKLRVKGRIVPLPATPTVDFVVQYLSIHLAGGAAMPLPAETSIKGAKPGTKGRAPWGKAGQTVAPGTADVLLTTGTTGRPKAVMLSHNALLANAENLIDAQGYSDKLRFVVCGPLNHIGSLSKLWPTLMAGGSLHLLDGLRQAEPLLRAIGRTRGPKASFLVPAALRMLLAFAHDKLQALSDRIDFIETGAAPISPAEMESLRIALPHSRLYNTYASTETGIVATHDFSQGDCQAGLLGRPMKHSRISIDAEGRIICHGATLMTGYLDDPADAQATLADQGFLTADQGYIDDQGRLILTGRIDDLINVGGLKVSPVEVEEAARLMPGVADCLCLPVAHPLMGQALKLLVVNDDGHSLDKRALAQFLRTRLEAHKVPTLFEQTDHIRRTFNGKADRKSYLTPDD